MEPVSIGVEGQRNTDGNTPYSTILDQLVNLHSAPLRYFVALSCVKVQRNTDGDTPSSKQVA